MGGCQSLVRISAAYLCSLAWPTSEAFSFPPISFQNLTSTSLSRSFLVHHSPLPPALLFFSQLAFTWYSLLAPVTSPLSASRSRKPTAKTFADDKVDFNDAAALGRSRVKTARHRNSPRRITSHCARVTRRQILAAFAHSPRMQVAASNHSTSSCTLSKQTPSPFLLCRGAPADSHAEVGGRMLPRLLAFLFSMSGPSARTYANLT